MKVALDVPIGPFLYSIVFYAVYTPFMIGATGKKMDNMLIFDVGLCA